MQIKADSATNERQSLEIKSNIEKMATAFNTMWSAVNSDKSSALATERDAIQCVEEKSAKCYDRVVLLESTVEQLRDALADINEGLASLKLTSDTLVAHAVEPVSKQTERASSASSSSCAMSTIILGDEAVASHPTLGARPMPTKRLLSGSRRSLL